jgi:hypothetical protein
LKNWNIAYCIFRVIMLGELLLRHLNELRLRKVHCDLELIASNQTSVFVHKIVMTALNKTHFQQALRTAGCSRPLSPCISKMYFSTLSGDELRLLVEFLYGAVINKQSKLVWNIYINFTCNAFTC